MKVQFNYLLLSFASLIGFYYLWPFFGFLISILIGVIFFAAFLLFSLDILKTNKFSHLSGLFSVILFVLAITFYFFLLGTGETGGTMLVAFSIFLLSIVLILTFVLAIIVGLKNSNKNKLNT